MWGVPPQSRRSVQDETVTDELTHLIWNTDHGAWWRPGGVGYSVRIEEAGRFTHRQALEECCRALVGWRPGTPYPDIPVVERDVMVMQDGDGYGYSKPIKAAG